MVLTKLVWYNLTFELYKQLVVVLGRVVLYIHLVSVIVATTQATRHEAFTFAP